MFKNKHAQDTCIHSMDAQPIFMHVVLALSLCPDYITNFTAKTPQDDALLMSDK